MPFLRSSFPCPSRAALLLAGLLLTGLIATAPATAQAARRVPATVTAKLDGAAREYGPAALLDTLKTALKANPRLAATPAAAAALARAAAAPVRRHFTGANLPVYRAIVAAIAAAAPEENRAAVHAAAAAAVGKTARRDTAGTVAPAPPKAAPVAIPPGQGFRLGSFLVSPEIQTAEFYDSNIFATKAARKEDLVNIVTPHVFLRSLWKRHKLTAEAHLDSTHYAENSDQDSLDYRVNAEGRYDFADNDTKFFGGVLAMRNHEDRSSPDAVSGIKPTIYYEGRAYAGLSHRFGDLTAKAGGTMARLVFNNVQGTAGTINNSDRDRSVYTYGLSLAYETGGAFTPYVHATADRRLYSSPVDDNGFRRSSRGGEAMAGADFTFFDGKLTGTAGLGYMTQDYDDAAFTVVHALAAKGNLLWKPRTDTRLMLYASRSIDETTLVGASSSLYTGIGGTVEHRLTPDLSVFLRGNYGKSDFQDITRNDDDYESSLGMRYALSPRAFIAADYRNQKRFSNIGTVSFNRDQIYLRLGLSY